MSFNIDCTEWRGNFVRSSRIQTYLYGSREMISLVTRHFNVNRLLLRAIGLWPYERSKFKRFQAMFFFGTLATNIIIQFITLLMSRWNIDFIVKILSFAFFLIICALHFYLFYFNTDFVKGSIEKCQKIWSELKNYNEFAIIEKYGNMSRQFTAGISVLSACGIVFFSFLPNWSHILDVVFPKNESQSHELTQIEVEYLVNEGRYFYLILLHTNAAIFIAMYALLSTSTMMIGWNRYNCGIFRIASYRIEDAMRTDVLRNIDRKNENFIYKRLIGAIDIHCKARKLVQYQAAELATTFLYIIIIIVASSSLNLFQIFQAMSHGFNFGELMMPVMHVMINYTYIFCGNFFCQDLMDHNNHVFETAYNVRWYIAPLHIQKFILFLLQKGTQAFTVNLGGVFTASLEGFAKLMKASISYFTVMYSMK